jgi:hypothetical protein
MNGPKFHVKCRTRDTEGVLAVVKKAPKHRGTNIWYADSPEDLEWIVKQSELPSFVDRLLRSDVDAIQVWKAGWK